MLNKIVRKNVSLLILLGIVFVAALLRLWQIGSVPPSPDWDEAALGYNAYSILNTGRDEYGHFLPVILRSFDDYKPSLYAYFIIPFIKLLGLNIISVRLPSALLGIVAVIASYFLVKELLRNKYSESIALLSSFLLAISPWHIHFSRIAFEAQTGLAFNILSYLFFLKGLKRYVYLPIFALFASLSIYIYQSEKVYLPILFLLFFIIYRKEIFKIPKKWIATTVITGAIFAFPMFFLLLTDKNSLLRAKGVSVFSDQTQFLKRNVQKIQQDRQNNDLIGLVVDNRRIEFAKAIASGYIAHFDLNWLFITGDIERHHAPNMGLLYLIELPFLLFGIYSLLFGNFDKKAKLIIFSILLIAPIPASITSGVPHAVRTINFLPTLQIFVAIGLFYSFLDFYKKRISIIVFPLFGLAVLISFTYYLNQYFVQQNYYFSENWQYGYKEAVDFVRLNGNRYKKVVVSNDRPLDQSYIFFLFYLQYDPKKYQNEGGTISGGFKEPHRGFENITFRQIDWNSEDKNGKVLYVGRADDFPRDINVLKEIYYLNKKTAIKIVD